MNTEVFGISVDSYASHAKFKRELNLPFDLLSDWDREVSKHYGAFNVKERVANRLSFLIDKKGRIIIDKTGDANWNSETVRYTIDALLEEDD